MHITNNVQPLTLNLRMVIGTGGFTAAGSYALPCLPENLTKSVSHMVCLLGKFSRSGQKTAFFSGNTKWRINCNHLCSAIKNAKF